MNLRWIGLAVWLASCSGEGSLRFVQSPELPDTTQTVLVGYESSSRFRVWVRDPDELLLSESVEGELEDGDITLVAFDKPAIDLGLNLGNYELPTGPTRTIEPERGALSLTAVDSDAPAWTETSVGSTPMGDVAIADRECADLAIAFDVLVNESPFDTSQTPTVVEVDGRLLVFPAYGSSATGYPVFEIDLATQQLQPIETEIPGWADLRVLDVGAAATDASGGLWLASQVSRVGRALLKGDLDTGFTVVSTGSPNLDALAIDAVDSTKIYGSARIYNSGQFERTLLENTIGSREWRTLVVAEGALASLPNLSFERSLFFANDGLHFMAKEADGVAYRYANGQVSSTMVPGEGIGVIRAFANTVPAPVVVRGSNNGHRLYRWRDEEWQPIGEQFQSQEINAVAALESGYLLVLNFGSLRRGTIDRLCGDASIPSGIMYPEAAWATSKGVLIAGKPAAGVDGWRFVIVKPRPM